MKKKLLSALLGVAFLVCGCVCLTACGGDKKQAELEIMTSENGSVEVLTESNGMKCLKPVANDGYFFLKWNVYEDGMFEREYFEGINWMNIKSYSAKKSYKVEPVFTDNADEFYFLPDNVFQVSGANDLNLEIEYLPYIAKERPSESYGTYGFEEFDNHYYTPYFTYFVKPNENLAISYISDFHLEDSGSFGGNFIERLHWLTPLTKHYSSGMSYFFSDHPTLNNPLQNVYINVVDLRVNPLITAKIEVDGKVVGEDYAALEKGQETSFLLSDKIYYNIASGYYLKSWKDEAGNFISNKKYLTITPQQNLTLIAVMKKADYVYKGEGSQELYFSENADHTLTLEAIKTFSFNVVVPSEVDGKVVTTISDCICISPDIKITIPETVINFGERTFMIQKSNVGPEIVLLGDKDIEFSVFYKMMTSERNVSFVSLTEKTLQDMIKREVSKLVKDAQVEIEFVEDYSSDDHVPVYENGKFTIPKLELVGNFLYRTMYTSNFFNALAQQIRKFYQDVALGNIDGLTAENLIVSASQEQVESWTTEEGRKTDAKEFAKNLLGFDCLSSRGNAWNDFV